MAAHKPKPGTYTEVERKFDVTEGTVAPSFDGLSAVARVQAVPAQSLDAVYYDTSGHDLARNRITLRRRTGGPDAGWHLKLPAGGDARTEVRAPLSDALPDELHDVVLAIVRDRPLSPVARISTTRSVQLLFDADERPIAEFCDDQVTASAVGGEEQRWREWELELADGRPDDGVLSRLGNRLLDAGATAAGHGSKLAKVLGPVDPADDRRAATDPIHRAVAEQVTELIRWDRAVRADADDAVHQMRVTTRKLRSLLAERGLADDAWVLDELRQLAAILGEARDAEVLADKYARALDALPAEMVRGPVRERLVDGARRRYATGLRHSLAAMRTTRYFRLLDELDALTVAPPTATAAAAPTVHAAYRRVRKAARAAHAATADRDAALHRIRKGAKRLRYTAAATGKGKVAEAAKAVQTLLGDHQDAVVSRTHLLTQADAAHAAGEDTFTYGLLYQQEDDLARHCRDQLDAALHKLKRAVK